jgi:hypothetical protein
VALISYAFILLLLLRFFAALAASSILKYFPTQLQQEVITRNLAQENFKKINQYLFTGTSNQRTKNYRAFSNTAITSVIIPASVTTIGDPLIQLLA